MHNSNQDKTSNNKSLFLGDTWEATLNQKYSNEDKLENVFLPGNYLYSHERDISFLSDNRLLKDLINKPFDLTESRIGCSFRDLKYKNLQLSSLYTFMMRLAIRVFESSQDLIKQSTKPVSIVEVGGGIGLFSVAFIKLLHALDKVNYIYHHIELPQTSQIQYEFLSKHFPEIVFKGNEYIEKTNNHNRIYTHSTDLGLPELGQADIFVNVMSICEMSEEYATTYINYFNKLAVPGSVLGFVGSYGMSSNSLYDVSEYPFSAKWKVDSISLESPIESLQEDTSILLTLQYGSTNSSLIKRQRFIRDFQASIYSGMNNNRQIISNELNPQSPTINDIKKDLLNCQDFIPESPNQPLSFYLLNGKYSYQDIQDPWLLLRCYQRNICRILFCFSSQSEVNLSNKISLETINLLNSPQIREGL